MQSLASAVGSLKLVQPEQPTGDPGPQRTVETLAKAHGLSVAEMLALWRGAGLTPPTDGARFQKYQTSMLLVPELRRRSAEWRAQQEEWSANRAWATTQLEGLARKRPRPTFAELLAMVRDHRLRAFAEKYDPVESGGAMLLGPTGKGKSIAALCMMIRCIREQDLAEFDASLKVPFDERVIPVRPKTWASIDALDLCTAQQHTGLNDPDPQCVERAKTADYLILEDLGWERGFHLETLIQVAAPRYRRCLPTIVTSGEKHEALRERYTDAVLRRFWNIDGRDGAVIDLWGSS